jgi:uncharacterized protein (DUF3084 family)
VAVVAVSHSCDHIIDCLIARAHQYLTQVLDKLELTQKKLKQANEEREKAVKQAESFKSYIDELQKVKVPVLRSIASFFGAV